jgi:23S rRNA (cytosine1962-C5)-methyltransferase
MLPGGGWIGRGIYNPSSRIRVRLYQWDQKAELDEAWVLGKLRDACAMRDRRMYAAGSLECLRLVNSEGDGLSGLIVDQFGDYLVVQVTSYAMNVWLEPILDWLEENRAPKGIQVRVDEKTAANEGLEITSEYVRGAAPEGPIVISDNGVKLIMDPASGQKTGYYLDQRQNRMHAASWIQGGSMLDICTYSGGFALAACRHGQPERVVAVDSSKAALEQAQKNAAENGFEQIEFVKADCFDYLEKLSSEKATFDSIVLDPPRMAGNRHQISAALRAYHRLNLSAVNLLPRGGLLVTCSCSGRVTRSDFSGMLASVAKRSRRSIQILETHGADFDHPIDVNCPESEYLKCFICRVG